ncbi:MAG: DUF3263 domain-containing protein [Acidimicrobiales bacterium]
MALSNDDRAILDFEQGWWLTPGSKEDAIKSTLLMSASSYYRRLGELLDDDEAMAHDPLLVRRLHRTREARRHARFDGHSAGQRRP